MTRITRSSLLLRLQDFLGINSAVSKVPTEINDKVSPVCEVGVRFSEIARSMTRTTTGNGTLYTTPADKDFYLTSISFGYTKSAASDETNSYIEVTIGGVARRLLAIPSETLTAYSTNAQMTYTYPIKLDRNSSILIVKSFTAGASTSAVCVQGFILE